MAQEKHALTLKFLGGVDIRENGAPVTTFVTQKALALFVYLAVTRQPHTRDHLDTLLWGNLDSVGARRALRYALWNLRRILGPFLVVTPQNVAFQAPADVASDLEEFLAYAPPPGGHAIPTEREIQNWRRAVELYRGEFLRGLHVREADEFDAWMLSMRERLHVGVLDTLLRLVAHETEKQNYASGISVARRLLELEPWNEAGHRALIQIHVSSGDAGAARAQYDTCRRILAAELNAEPTAATTALVAQLDATATISAPEPPSPAAQHNLPAARTPFFGREAEIERILEKLRDPTCRLLTLTGEGGIGKTRLALQVASELTAEFADGVWFVRLSGLQARRGDIPLVMARAIAHALDLAPDPAIDLTRQVADYIRTRRLVLVLDNMEQLLGETEQDADRDDGESAAGLDSAAWIDALLTQAREVRVLVTSRTRLNLQSEFVLRLNGLEVPPDTQDPDLQNYSSVQLFLERAERAGISAGELDPAQVARLCQLVEGLPLAIELAAAWMNRTAPQDVIKVFEAKFDAIATTQRDIPARHRSLRAVFENSWRLLSLAEQSALAQASVFQQRFTREAAERIIVGQDAPSNVPGANDDILSAPLLERLVEKSLVRWVTWHPGFRLHPLVRQYAGEKLSLSSRDSVRHRHAAFFLDYLAARAGALTGPETHNAINEIHDALADILVAWDWGIQHGQFEKIEAAQEGLAAFYEYAGMAREGSALFDRTVQAVAGEANVPLTLLPGMQQSLAKLLLRLGRHAEAQTLAEHVVNVGQVRNDAKLEVWGRYLRALALARLPDTDLELAELERAREQAHRSDLTRLEGLCLLRAGMVTMRAGQYRAAKEHMLQASRFFETVNDLRYVGGCYAMLGLAEYTLGELDSAIMVQTRAIEIADQIRDEYLKAVTLHNLGNTLASEGKYEKALACMEQSKQMYGHLGTSVLVIGSQAQAGLFLTLMGRWAEARSTLEHAAHVASAENMPREFGWSNRGLAMLARRQGEFQDAVHFARLALEPATRWNDANDRAEAAITLADALVEAGVTDEAKEHYLAALALREQIQQPHLYPEAHVGLAYIALQRGESQAARAWIEKTWSGESLRLASGPAEPFWVYWTGYLVMRALDDPRAPRLVETAQFVLAEYISQISDPSTRDQFLQVPWHRAILDTDKNSYYPKFMVVPESVESSY